jgi:hypothetical protein
VEHEILRSENWPAIEGCAGQLLIPHSRIPCFFPARVEYSLFADDLFTCSRRFNSLFTVSREFDRFYNGISMGWHYRSGPRKAQNSVFPVLAVAQGRWVDCRSRPTRNVLVTFSLPRCWSGEGIPCVPMDRQRRANATAASGPRRDPRSPDPREAQSSGTEGEWPRRPAVARHTSPVRGRRVRVNEAAASFCMMVVRPQPLGNSLVN